MKWWQRICNLGAQLKNPDSRVVNGAGFIMQKKERRSREDGQGGRERVLLPSRHVNHDGGSSRGRAFMLLGRLRGDAGAGNWRQVHCREWCGRGLGYWRQSNTRVRLVTQLHICTPTFVRLLPT